jgi:UDP-N-acetylglucosamine 4,6-dehydratase
MKIVVTGGAGSIGRAFVRLLNKDHKIIAIDSNEWAVAEFQKEFPKVEVILGDFIDYDFYHQPDLVIHCAAYKHINLGEENPEAFIQNNIIKTLDFFKRLNELGTDFIFISTDKAVKPISLYGSTKYIGEKLAYYYGGVVARLGNVIGSSGSVIPVWEKCIREERPIPITDERMVRYFIDEMTAVSQIWALYHTGERTIIPTMQKVRLLDFLAEVLKKHGYDKASDYKPGVEIIGLRPGEKLEEELEWE